MSNKEETIKNDPQDLKRNQVELQERTNTVTTKNSAGRLHGG